MHPDYYFVLILASIATCQIIGLSLMFCGINPFEIFNKFINGGDPE